MSLLDLLLRAFIAGMLEEGYIPPPAGSVMADWPEEYKADEFQFRNLVMTMIRLPVALSMNIPDPQAFCALQIAMELCAKHSIWAGKADSERASEEIDYWMQRHCLHDYWERDLFSTGDFNNVHRRGELAMITYSEIKRLIKKCNRYSPLIGSFDWLNEQVHRIFNEMAEQRAGF